MKKLLTIVSLIFSTSCFAAPYQIKDTISNWQVYNGGKLLKAFNAHSKDFRIVLTKGKIRAGDTLNVKYFDDTPFKYCNAILAIKTKDNKTIKIVNNSKSSYDFDVKTIDLQVLAFKNKSSILKFCYKETESGNESFLFEIEIK